MDKSWPADRIAAHTRGRVLDVGCGEGRFLPRRGVGVDVNASRLTVARSLSPLVCLADAHALPFAGSTFDTAYAHRMLNDAAPIDPVLAEIARVLRPRGRLLVLTRARHEDGDRLDQENGAARLARFFDHVDVEHDPADERAALFVADMPRGRS